jgi:tRNA(Ile)-lysidine synthase
MKLPFRDSTVIAAVSGGADSVSLLLGLHDLSDREKLTIKLIVAHFDHGLRGKHSRADAEFVRELSKSLDLQCVVGKGRVATTGNLEENARVARYSFLDRTSRKYNAELVLTGHTMDDQAETVLFNLIRGSGPDGLGGIRAIRPLDSDIRLVRPLMNWARRRDTEAFCHDSKVEYRRDPMNEDASFARVRIRKELIPLLTTYNPKIVETLARTSRLFTPTSEAIPPETLKLSEISDLESADRFRILRNWLGSRRRSLRSVSMKHIESIDRLASSGKSGREVEVPGGGRVIKRSGSLVFEANKG